MTCVHIRPAPFPPAGRSRILADSAKRERYPLFCHIFKLYYGSTIFNFQHRRDDARRTMICAKETLNKFPNRYTNHDAGALSVK